MGVSGLGSGGGGGAGEREPLSSHHGPSGSSFSLLLFHFLSWYDVTVTAIQSTRSDSFKSVVFIKEKIYLMGFSENTRNNHQKIKKTKKISKSAQKSYIVSVRLDLLQAENFSVANPANMSKPERVFFCFFSVMFLLH